HRNQTGHNSEPLNHSPAKFTSPAFSHTRTYSALHRLMTPGRTRPMARDASAAAATLIGRASIAAVSALTDAARSDKGSAHQARTRVAATPNRRTTTNAIAWNGAAKTRPTPIR